MNWYRREIVPAIRVVLLAPLLTVLTRHFRPGDGTTTLTPSNGVANSGQTCDSIFDVPLVLCGTQG